MYSHVLSVSTFGASGRAEFRGSTSPFITMELWVSITLAALLVALSGLFSGLNLGLMSFTEDDLKVVIQGSADAKEVEHAEAIRPVRSRGNLLLCTLLLGNTLVNAVIAVLLADLTSGLVGTLVTTALILVFGEILPQSVCSRHALLVGATVLPIVKCFIVICWPIAFPISLLLDQLLGREISGVFNRQGLLALVRLNVEDEEHQAASGLTLADARLLGGALSYQDELVEDVMTPIDMCFCLPLSTRLDQPTFLKILKNGHTRIPVYDGDDPTNVVALLFSKDLLGIGFERNMELATVVKSFDARSRVHRVGSKTTLDYALAKCQRDRVHLLVVCGNGEGDVADDDPAAAQTMGIATIEDFLEEILGEEIVDENDVYVSNAVGSSPPVARSPTKVLLERVRPPTMSSMSGVGSPVRIPTTSTESEGTASAGQSRKRAKRRPKGDAKPELRRLNSRHYDTTALLGSLSAGTAGLQKEML